MVTRFVGGKGGQTMDVTMEDREAGLLGGWKQVKVASSNGVHIGEKIGVVAECRR